MCKASSITERSRCHSKHSRGSPLLLLSSCVLTLPQICTMSSEDSMNAAPEPNTVLQKELVLKTNQQSLRNHNPFTLKHMKTMRHCVRSTVKAFLQDHASSMKPAQVHEVRMTGIQVSMVSLKIQDDNVRRIRGFLPSLVLSLREMSKSSVEDIHILTGAFSGQSSTSPASSCGITTRAVFSFLSLLHCLLHSKEYFPN